MTLAITRSETRTPAFRRGDRTPAQVQNPSAAKEIPHAEDRRKRRDHYRSANGDRRGLYRSETETRDPFRDTPRLSTAFAAQVIGQVLETTSANKSGYAQTRRPMQALLLDRSV